MVDRSLCFGGLDLEDPVCVACNCQDHCRRIQEEFDRDAEIERELEIWRREDEWVRSVQARSQTY